MFIKASIVFLLSVQVAQVVQAKKWLAKIKAGHQCDNVYRRQLLNENNYKVFEYQDGDCLIEFESDEYSKVLMDHMNDIETIEPDQEMFANYLWDLDRMDQKNLPLDKVTLHQVMMVQVSVFTLLIRVFGTIMMILLVVICV